MKPAATFVAAAVAAVTTFSMAASASGPPASSSDPGSSAELDELIAAAQAEGSVLWYNSQAPSLTESALAAFEDLYGIETEYLRLTSSELATRYASERDSGINDADVITIGDNGFYADGAENGWWVPLDVDSVPAIADWPADAVHFDDTTAMIGSQPLVVGYNTDLLSEPPESFDDLLDPELDGRMLFSNPEASPVPLGYFDVLYEDPDYGPDFLEALGAQNLGIVDSAVGGTEQVASGEYAVIFVTTISLVEDLKAQGAPIDWAYLEPISATQVYSAIPTEAAHPNAARLLMNFLLTLDGQAAYLVPGYGVSVLGDLPGSLAEPPVSIVQPDYQRAKSRLDEIRGLLFP